jgi:hypothetical protein
VESGTKSYVIDVSDDTKVNKVRIQGAADLSWMDTLLSNDLLFVICGIVVFIAVLIFIFIASVVGIRFRIKGADRNLRLV